MNSNISNQLPWRWFKLTLPIFIGLSLFLGFWQYGAHHYGSLILPSPLETGSALVRLAKEGKLSSAVLSTTFHLSCAFIIAVLLSILLGIAAGINVNLRRAISPIITALQGIPPIAWIVLALLWFGSGEAPSIFTITVAIIPIFFISTIEGMDRLPLSLLEMGRLFHAPKSLLISDLYFPHLLSYLFPAVAAGLGLAWRVAVMAELLSSETGIGAELNLARINLDTDEVMAWIVVVVVLIWLCEYVLLRPLRRWLEPWRFHKVV